MVLDLRFRDCWIDWNVWCWRNLSHLNCFSYIGNRMEDIWIWRKSLRIFSVHRYKYRYQKLGYFVGSLLSGPIADKIGRRKPLVVSSLLMFAVAFVGAFMPNFALYTIFVSIVFYQESHLSCLHRFHNSSGF